MLVSLALAAVTGGAAAPPVSAPLANITYEISYDRESAARRRLAVTMRFEVTGPGDVLLSLPVWTPGAYEVTNFARWVVDFAASGSAPLRWDKLDYDTWRIRPAGAKRVTVSFGYVADTLDNAMAWSRPDFVFFNGTNVLLYPEGRGFDFAATVRIRTEADWLVATGMSGTPAGGFTERSYHDLVDMPFFVGRFDYDSAEVGDLTARLATYPAGRLSGTARQAFWDQYRKLFAPQVAVFGEKPFRRYTTLLVFPDGFGGGSALEHQNSHVGIYAPDGIGQEWVTSVTAHEIFHAFNVKRLRPAELMPYRYDVAQPTVWLWVSEGITDYYADLTLLRGGLIDSAGFLATTADKITSVRDAPPTALEDASLSTWIHPVDGSAYLYYPKGSLAGLLLDILIRDASDNRRSLDHVMRELYATTYKRGRGFAAADWWGAVSRAAGGRRFDDFETRFIDGRDPFPWDSVLALAGLRLVTESIPVPRLGLTAGADSQGVVVQSVIPGGAAAEAGLEPGDVLLRLGDIPASEPDVFDRFRTRFGTRPDAEVPIQVRRGGRELTLRAKVRIVVLTNPRLVADPGASPKAVRVRTGLFTGTTGR
jgi:predicted metalloprotease with PDZ domain